MTAITHDERRLKRLWRIFEQVVSACVRRRKMLLITEAQYEELRSRILETSQTLPADVAKRFEDIVEPWIHLETLRHTEPKILKNLLAQCHRIDDEMKWHKPIPFRLILRALLVCLFGAVAYMIYNMSQSEDGLAAFSDGLGGWWAYHASNILRALQRPMGMIILTAVLVTFGVLFTRYNK